MASLATLALISAGLGVAGAAGGAIGSAVNTKKARDEESKSYKDAQNYLNSMYYRDPLSTVGNRALLKSMDERMKKNMDALENRAVAGGATMENQLAARQANNEVMGNVYSNLLQGEDARRDRLDQQKIALNQQHSVNLQNSYYKNAQDWQAWGAQMGNSGMQLGSSLLGAHDAGLKVADLIGG